MSQPKLTNPSQTKITTIGNIYIQRGMTQPEQYPIKTQQKYVWGEEHQVYTRTYSLKNSWEPVDLGWVVSPYKIIIFNEESQKQQTIPTEAELEMIKKRKVLISFDSVTQRPALAVEVGDYIILTPTTPDIFLKSASQTAKIRLIVIPNDKLGE